jgi:DNA-binding response OmpR family regulator/DNA-binding CsgD family transcriptional regulator
MEAALAATPVATLGTVMIVDDTPANLAVLSDALQEQGYRVLVATDGYSALEQLRYIKPDVILLDGMMPGMDGFETCQRIKQDRTTQSIPILFMTALGDIDNLLRGFNEGAIDYIVKPFRHEEVLARVGAQVSQRRLLARVEQTLQENALAALAIDRSGVVTWLTQHAAQMFEADAIHIAQPLPGALLEPVLRSAENGTAKIYYRDLSLKIAPCGYGSEYLILLQKNGNHWDADALRGDLGLTAREAEILMWISRGKTNREIGTILDTSPRTVNKHLEHIFEKLGVGTRSAAVSVALQHAKAEI